MEGMELLCFQMITFVGSARSNFIEAIEFARQLAFEEANKRIDEGKAAFIEGHKIHGKILAECASNTDSSIPLLLVHAEDQLMSAETFQILASEFIDLYRIVHKQNK